MSQGVTVSSNTLEGDAKHGICIGFNFPMNRVSDVVIANNLCRGSASKTLWIEAADSGSSLRAIVASGNVITGGSHGVYLGTGAAGAVLDDVMLANNLVNQADIAGYLVSDHVVGQSTNVRLVGNAGAATLSPSNVSMAEDRDNSWNAARGQGTSAPARGAWERGAIIFNSAPSPGAPLGWVCTASGQPGTWSPFGAIGA
jgi:hypothetical protein